MRKFRFELEAVERVRKAKEEETLRALGVTQRALVQEQNRKANLFIKLGNSLTRREQIGGLKELNSSDVGIETDFIEGTKIRIQQAEMAIQRAQKAVNKAFRAFIVAKRQVRMMEVLREKALEEYKKKTTKLEQKAMDDLNIMRANINEQLRTGEVKDKEGEVA